MCRKSNTHCEGMKTSQHPLRRIRRGGFTFLLYVIAALIMAAGIPAGAAVSIEVENFSFELPGTVKQHCWDGERPEGGVFADVPGWTDGSLTSNDSGVETGFTTAAEGSYTGFLMGGDPPVYNLTNFLIGSGDVFELKVNARNNWVGTTFKISLYYDDNGTRVPVAAYTAPVTSDLLTSPTTLFSLTFSADTVPTCYDHEIGIELNNVTTASASWVGFDNVQLTLTSPLYRAHNPYPAHKSSYDDTSVTLTWTAGPNVPGVDSYHVYLSDNRADVNSGVPAADKGLIGDTSYNVSELVLGKTYYWRIDTVNGANSYRGNIWNFNTRPSIAYNPFPDTGSKYVPVDTTLTWEAGHGAAMGHVVFFGDNFDDVNNAPIGTSGSVPFRAYLTNPADVDWALEETDITRETEKTYYWRIDEVESTSPLTIHKGTVWSFTTVPIVGLGSITHEVWENITGSTIAELTGNPNYPDNPSFTDYLPLFDTPRDWADNYGTRVHGWLYVETTGDYTFWLATDDTGELWLDNDMIASNTGAIGYHQWDASPQSAPIHLEAGNLYYIMALQKEGSDSDHDTLAVAWSTSDDDTTATIIPGTNLLPFEMYSRVWSFGPNPANGTTDIRIDSNLIWRPGAYADEHNVYFGTDFTDVNDANTSADGIYKGRHSDTTYTPGTLEFNTTYYWRIDGVNDLNPDSPWAGDVWSFTTGNFLVVDDFEDYNDYAPDRIFDVWADYAVNNTGMTVGHLDPPFAERTIVHSGRQAMYMRYDNDGTVNEGTDYEQSGTLTFSETERQWVDPQDWTRESVESLTLWFRGIPASVGSFTIGPPITMTGAGADIWENSDQFHYAYKRLSGVGSITAKVISMTNTHDSAKAGVMIRESLEAGSTHAMVNIQPMNEVQFLRRLETALESEADGQDGVSTPVWVRLTRSGNTFTGEYSVDGNTWETLGSATIPMLLDVYIGLIVCSHDANATCTAEFSDVTTTGSVTGEWQSQDIGINSNVAEPLYVTLKDSTGNSVVVTNPDPAATTVNTWTEWNIPFTNLIGVNLQSITELSIGVGSEDNIQPGGAGDLYIDDIRLHRSSSAE